jgi:predicted nucleotidyltransferase
MAAATAGFRASPCADRGSQFAITFIVAFGSRVRGITHARSDLDIGILCRRGFDAGILGELSAVFPGQDVDVALLNRADPLLLKGVSDAAVLLSGEEKDLQEFRMYAFRRYAERRPFFALEKQVNARHLAGT